MCAPIKIMLSMLVAVVTEHTVLSWPYVTFVLHKSQVIDGKQAVLLSDGFTSSG